MENNPRDNPLASEITGRKHLSTFHPRVFCSLGQSIVGKSILIDVAVGLGILVAASAANYGVISLYEAIFVSSPVKIAPVRASDLNDNYSHRNTGHE